MYTDSLVAFLDILGLTDRIRETETDHSAVASIAGVLNEVNKIASTINSDLKESLRIDISAHAFSDSIILSCPEISRRSFIAMANIVSETQFDIMGLEFFLRGAISAGAHYEKDGIAFGPAYIKAYEMEKLSVWPRVMIAPVVLQKLPPQTVEAAVESYLVRDQSGLCYLNYLDLVLKRSVLLPFVSTAKGEPRQIDVTKILEQHKQYLLSAITNLKAKGQLHLLPKYHAVADYHNCYMRALYEDLPKTADYREVDPTTGTGQLINSFKEFASTQKEVKSEDIESIIQEYTRGLYEDRDQIQACEIDLVEVFGELYPHINAL